MKGFVKIDRTEIEGLMRLGASSLKLYICLLARADYRTGEYTGTYRILMAETGLARATVCSALRELRSGNQTTPIQISNRSGLKIRLAALPYTAKKKENNTHTASADVLVPTREQLESYAATCGFASDRVLAFWHHHTAYGWRTPYGNPIADWRSALHRWMERSLRKPAGKIRPIWTKCEARCRFWNSATHRCDKFVVAEPDSPDSCRYF